MRGSVVKKPNGRYYIVYYLGKKQKWEKVPEPNTKKNASRLLAQRVNEINRGEYREIKKVTFREFADRWLEDYVDDPNHVKTSTSRNYHSVFHAHLLPAFGEYGLTDITPDLVQGLVSRLSKAGKAPRTIHGCLAPMTKMLNHAVKWGYLRSSPMPYVEKPKIRKEEKAFLTSEEVRRFLDRAPPAWHTFFVVAVMTGMRLGELLAMRWKHLNFEGGQYQVRERLYEGLFDTPKSQTSIRTVDLTRRVLEALRAHKAAQNELKLRLGPAYDDTDLVFCGDAGEPITNPKPIRVRFQEALKAAACPPVQLHDLRHSYVALLIAQGASPKYIQRQLGHASIQMTFDIYGHLMPDAREEIIQGLDEQVFGEG